MAAHHAPADCLARPVRDITPEELRVALGTVRLWFRQTDNGEVAYRGTVLHPVDAADDIMAVVGRMRATEAESWVLPARLRPRD